MNLIKPPFGQHFLHDKNFLALIVKTASLSPGDQVLEVGCGTGKLTRAILDTGAAVTGVEVDRGLAGKLENDLAQEGAFRLVSGDILSIDWDQLLAPTGRATIMGNLPYSVSTQVLFRIMDWRERISRAVFLMQWEVGCRLTANPGTKEYGILAVACQLFGKPELVRKVPPTVFLPPPKVDSALIRWDIFEKSPHHMDDWRHTLKVVRASFGKRRKTLLNSLSSGLEGLSKQDLGFILREMGIPDAIRAEGLQVSQFAELSNRIGTLQ